MAKSHCVPIIGVMTVGAGGSEVIARRAVALRAVGKAFVSDPYLLPGSG